MAVLIHWFPQRRFVFLGDGGYASHDLARFCARHRRHATQRHRIHIRQTLWYVKAEPTFSDAIATVRRLFWQKTIFEEASYHNGFKKLSPKLKNLLLDYLSQAA